MKTEITSSILLISMFIVMSSPLLLSSCSKTTAQQSFTDSGGESKLVNSAFTTLSYGAGQSYSSPSQGITTDSPTAVISPRPSPIPEKDNVDNRDFSFNGTISKTVLKNYLSKYITFNGFAAFAGYGSVPGGPDPDFEEDFRLIKSIGAMFIGRSAHVWGIVSEEAHYNDAKNVADKVHAYNSAIILEAAVFESVQKDNVNRIPIPEWVFKDFSLPVVARNFNYADMLFSDGSYVNQWGANTSVPDLTRQETQLWFYYRCCRYINSGYEAIHLGQLSLMSKKDSQKEQTIRLLDRIRTYAKNHARRKLVLLSAHAYSEKETTYQKNGKTFLMLDYHTFPLRPKDVFPGNKTMDDGYQPTMLEKGFSDSIYGRSAGGINPSGWITDYNPFVVEFDNSGYDMKNKDTNFNRQWPWGYDEITWFARQPEDRRSQILKEFNAWISGNYEFGFLSFPGRIPLAYPFAVTYAPIGADAIQINPVYIFKANNQSSQSKASFNLESTMKELWKNPK